MNQLDLSSSVLEECRPLLRVQDTDSIDESGRWAMCSNNQTIDLTTYESPQLRYLVIGDNVLYFVTWYGLYS